MTKGGSLVYEICALQTYRIQSSRWTFYLRINEISVFGLGYILFYNKLWTHSRRIKRKAIVKGTKLHLPIPYDFNGEIYEDQCLGTLKIIPGKTYTIKLYKPIEREQIFLPT